MCGKEGIQTQVLTSDFTILFVGKSTISQRAIPILCFRQPILCLCPPFTHMGVPSTAEHICTWSVKPCHRDGLSEKQDGNTPLSYKSTKETFWLVVGCYFSHGKLWPITCTLPCSHVSHSVHPCGSRVDRVGLSNSPAQFLPVAPATSPIVAPLEQGHVSELGLSAAFPSNGLFLPGLCHSFYEWTWHFMHIIRANNNSWATHTHVILDLTPSQVAQGGLSPRAM